MMVQAVADVQRDHGANDTIVPEGVKRQIAGAGAHLLGTSLLFQHAQRGHCLYEAPLPAPFWHHQDLGDAVSALLDHRDAFLERLQRQPV